uniref:Uncharacterized protein n=2 Tax=Ixodes scapularis TaxID=6945 RepID=A0A1S4L0Z6_IXOSC
NKEVKNKRKLMAPRNCDREYAGRGKKYQSKETKLKENRKRERERKCEKGTVSLRRRVESQVRWE